MAGSQPVIDFRSSLPTYDRGRLSYRPKGRSDPSASLSSITPSLPQAATPSQTPYPTFTETYYNRATSLSQPIQSLQSHPPPSAPPVVFAAIGDYGSGNQNEADVAKLVLSWQPDFIITLGDNNYPSGAADHMDEAVGQFFHSYIYPYTGNYGSRGGGKPVSSHPWVTMT